MDNSSSLSLDDFFSSLDSEVSKLTAKSRLEADKKALLSKVRRTDPDRAGRIRISNEIAEINHQLEAIQWRTTANVGLFQESHCTYCGSIHRMFLQHMAKQITTSGHPCTRYARVTSMSARLPSETVIHKSKTLCCPDCAEEFGYNFDEAAVKIAEHSEPFAIAAGYEQVEEELEG